MRPSDFAVCAVLKVQMASVAQEPRTKVGGYQIGGDRPPKTPSQSSTGISSEQILEIDALKKEIGQLHTVREQLATNIASLQLKQQELEQLDRKSVV